MLKIKAQIPNEHEETIADLGYIKAYVRALKKRIKDDTLADTYLNQIFDLADKVYQRFRSPAGPPGGTEELYPDELSNQGQQ